MKLLILLVLSFVMAFSVGCQTKEKIADGVKYYCSKPIEERVAYRSLVNSQLAATGHSIIVNCANDKGG